MKQKMKHKVWITSIYYLDFIHCPYVLQPQRFEGWFFPRHHMNLLLGLVDQASLH
jgi:hypothetical protein